MKWSWGQRLYFWIRRIPVPEPFEKPRDQRMDQAIAHLYQLELELERRRQVEH